MGIIGIIGIMGIMQEWATKVAQVMIVVKDENETKHYICYVCIIIYVGR